MAVRALDAEGRTHEALQRLERSLETRQADTEGELLRGVLLAKLGRAAEARKLFRDLIRRHPDLAEAYNNLAVMYASAGDLDSAIETLKQGLGTDATYRTTYENLSKVYGKLASEAYSEALGEDRLAAEPLQLAMINTVTEPGPVITEPAPSSGPAVPSEPVVPAPQPMAAQEPAAPVEEPATAVERPEPGSSAATAAAASERPEPGQAVETLATPDQVQAIWQTVAAWAAAWAGQRSEEYLSYYGADFEPPGGASRADWESQRRQRLSAPSYIRISLARLAVEEPSPGLAVARFVQSYESDRFSDTVTKVLDLARTGAGWQIVRERVEGVAE